MRQGQSVIDQDVSYTWRVYEISGRFVRSVEASADYFGLDAEELMDVVKNRQNEARRKKRERNNALNRCRCAD